MKEEADVEMTPEEEEEHANLKKNMNNPIPLDENHPGWNNLIPKEKRRFKNYREKEDDGDMLNPDEEVDQDFLKDIIKNGRPIDENHPGFDNLNPE